MVESFFVVLTNDESSSPCTAVLPKCEELCREQILNFMPAAVQNHLSLVSLVCPRLVRTAASHSILLYLTEFIAKNTSLSALIAF